MADFDREQWIAEQKARMKACESIVIDTLENYKENPELISEYLLFAGKFHRYSLRNQMLLQRQNPDCTFVGGFYRFKELGYHVKKGEVGMKVFAPVTVKYLYNGNTGELIPLKEATPEQKKALQHGGYELREFTNYKLETVFDISQTDCPVEDYPKLFDMGYASADHKAVADALERYCTEQLHCPVKTGDVRSIAVKGYYTPAEHCITLSDKLQDTERMVTLAHEMGHAILHSDPDLQKGKTVAEIEVEADALGMMTISALGLEKIAEIPENHKRHMCQNFKAVCKACAAQVPEKRSEPDGNPLEKILGNVNQAFQQHFPNMEKTVKQYLQAEPQLTPQLPQKARAR